MMARYGHLLFLAAVLALLIFTSAYSEGRAQAAEKRIVDARAADFSLVDIEGKRFKLSDYRGKPVLLLFGTTWCAYCRAEIPHFKEIHDKYGRRGLEVVNVDIQEPRERVVRFARRYEISYRILLDEEGSVAELYSILGVPTYVLIDGTGKIICWQCRTLDSYLERLFKR